MCHIVDRDLGHHCHLPHSPMPFITLVRQELSPILINMYMADSINYDMLCLYIYYSLSIVALNFLSMHFYCLLFLSLLHALTCSHFQTASQQHLRNETYTHTQVTLMIPYIYILYVYTVRIYCMYILYVYTLCI